MKHTSTALQSLKVRRLEQLQTSIQEHVEPVLQPREVALEGTETAYTVEQAISVRQVRQVDVPLRELGAAEHQARGRQRRELHIPGGQAAGEEHAVTILQVRQRPVKHGELRQRKGIGLTHKCGHIHMPFCYPRVPGRLHATR